MVHKKEAAPMSLLWGGIECTINRVDNDYLDQLDLAGFYNHPEWINDIAGLGIKMLRFPVLWEKHQPSLSMEIDWSFTQQQLEVLRNNNINPIAGLLHHGSGPAFTNLLDPVFPQLFADYASQVAAKFPWIKYYTPVNEPLTTARFSGLYGLWFPHKKNDVSFIKMLLNQLKGTVLAMQEIKKINPEAILVQTEDLGKTYSTSLLSYQAAFENKRRWLTYDILCGSFNQQHPLWNYFIRLGIDKNELDFFITNPCPPGIMGVNHYLTSERYLDDKIKSYPPHLTGGNSLHQYVDVEAVRVEFNEPHGIKTLLWEIWQRYKIPLAITEVHLHCSREEQMRWFKYVWDAAHRLKEEQVDIVGITCWALLGSFGWNKLLTSSKTNCDYETGAFDISAGYTRATALAKLLKNLITGKTIETDILQQPGWWQLDTRYLVKSQRKHPMPMHVSPRPVIIVGKGTLGTAFERICKVRNIHYYLLGRNEVDICISDQLEQMITRYKPWAIINTAGYVNVEEAEKEQETCYRENYLGPQKLAILCEKYKVKLLTFSSDLVFNGHKEDPYYESDMPDPLNIYGNSKSLSEKFLQNVNPQSLIIRSSAFFGPWDKNNFATRLLSDLNEGKTVVVPADMIISPTYIPHLVHASLDLLIDGESGIWHLANKGEISWYDFAVILAEDAGFDASLIEPGRGAKSAIKRPRYSVLGSEKYNLMPSLEKGISDYLMHSELLTQQVKI